MNIDYQKITLDVWGAYNRKVITAHQGDSRSRFIEVTLTQNGTVIQLNAAWKAVIKASNNGQVKAINNCGIDNNKVEAEITSVMLDTPGNLNCEISIIDGEQLITSAVFTVCVVPSTTADETEIVKSPEYGALNRALTTVQDVANKADLVQELVDDIADLENTTNLLNRISTNENNITNLNSRVNDNYSSLTSGKVDYYNAGAGDLNSFKLQNTHSDVAVYTLKGGYTHAPSDVTGIIYGYMIVGKQTSGTNIWIEQTLYIDDKIYHRRYTEYNSSGSWSEWVRLATSADISNLQQQINNIQPGSQLPNADEMGF